MIEKIKHEKYKILKRNIIEDSDFTKETMFILICAMIIASIGLNTNSVAVIIGAMLISPLMSPIQSLGLGLSNGNLKRVYVSLFRLGIFILISVVSSTFYFLVSPINDATPQILARTYPTLWDVLIAIFGGTAGVIAKTEEDGGNVVPGVAIATALMPPLCVVGFGIAHGNLKIFLGAGYLFIINVFFIMIATLVEKGTYVLRNVPDLRDIRTLVALLESLGLEVEKLDANSYKIINNGLSGAEASYDLVKKMRASFLVMGGMLAIEKRGKVALPGGCAIGARPVDLHLKGFEALGAKINIEHGYVEATTENGLIGGNIVLDFPSVGATENIIMAAVKAKGKTILENAAKEPEIEDLCNFLIKMGAKITGVGTSRLEIDGVDKLTACEYSIIPDRIVAGTYIIASILFDGSIKVSGIVPDHLSSFLLKLEEMGAKFKIEGDRLEVLSKLSDLKPVKVTTMPHPGFPTDLQSPMMTLMCLVNGASEIKETIFENRFMHVPELNRMGARIEIDSSTAKITGVENFSSAEVMASDLRAGASLILAALKANGESLVNRIYHVDRGYENFEEKFKALGANIERIKTEA